MLISLLAILSAAAAAGLRSALPLLVIGLLSSDFWENTPILSHIHPQVVLAILISWSLFELFGSKSLLGQRVLQLIALMVTPIVGALMSVTVARILQADQFPLWFLVVLGGLVALVIKLVQIGWFFRLRGLPVWVAAIEDVLCVGLVFFAVKAPYQGGFIALLLLWLVIRSSMIWRDRYGKGRK
jgi:hypothetical protein